MPWSGRRVRGRSSGAVVGEIGPDSVTGNERQFDCDTIVMSGGFQPSSALLHQAGATFMRDFDVDADIPVNLPESVHAAGDVTAIHDPTISTLQGRLAGLEASLVIRPSPNGSRAFGYQTVTEEEHFLIPPTDAHHTVPGRSRSGTAPVRLLLRGRARQGRGTGR